jgi:hypothetical protein
MSSSDEDDDVWGENTTWDAYIGSIQPKRDAAAQPNEALPEPSRSMDAETFSRLMRRVFGLDR